MLKKELTAIELIEQNNLIMEQQTQLNEQMGSLRKLIKEKQEQINSRINDELIDWLGRSFEVYTEILGNKAVITIVVHYGFTIIYSDADMEIEMGSNKKSGIKLSKLNAIASAIEKILKTEGLN